MIVRIPGPPRPHGRPRHRVQVSFSRAYTAPKDKSWRGAAQVHMLEEVKAWDLTTPLTESALRVHVLAVFPCPTSDHRKRKPRPRRWHTKRGDTDNIAKAVLDAGNGILWNDDAQVAVLHVEKVIAAQGEAPFVEIEVTPLTEEPK